MSKKQIPGFDPGKSKAALKAQSSNGQVKTFGVGKVRADYVRAFKKLCADRDQIAPRVLEQILEPHIKRYL